MERCYSLTYILTEDIITCQGRANSIVVCVGRCCSKKNDKFVVTPECWKQRGESEIKSKRD